MIDSIQNRTNDNVEEVLLLFVVGGKLAIFENETRERGRKKPLDFEMEEERM